MITRQQSTVPVPAARAEPAPKPAAPVEETAAEIRRADRDYWVDRDWGGEYDDPSDHYYC
jgi:hypothetical protein